MKHLISKYQRVTDPINQLRSSTDAAKRGIIIDIMMDSTIVDKRAEIDAEVIGRESLDIRYLRIELAIEDGDLTAAQTLLDNIPNDLPLRGLKDPEYLDYVTCYEILIDLLGTGSSTLSQSREDQLYLIAEKRATRASGLAQIMLINYTDYLFDEVLVDPEATAKSRRNWDPRKPKISSEPSVNIYPNPASDHIVIEFRNWGEQIEIAIHDAAGRSVRKESITSSLTAHVIDVSDLSKGNYTILLRLLDGKLTEQRQIEVLR